MSDIIPVEILQKIFKQCASGPSPLQAYKAHMFPWYGHVCSRWRALLFSMHSTFWNEIIIYDWMQRTLDKYIEGIVAFFLDRTCGKPFSFKYCVNAGSCCTFDDILAHLIDHNSEHWEGAVIRLSPSELEHLCGIKRRLPLLMY
jgi:hypothetical protein